MTSRNGHAQFQPQQEALLAHGKLAANNYFSNYMVAKVKMRVMKEGGNGIPDSML